MSHRIFKVRTQTCMDCGTTQRRRIPMIGDELEPVACWNCGSDYAWMVLPRLNATEIERDEVRLRRAASMIRHPAAGQQLAFALSELPEEVGIEMLQAFANLLGVNLTIDDDEDEYW